MCIRDRSIPTNLDHKSNPFTVRLITYSCNPFDPFFLHQANDVLVHLGFIDHIRELSDNNPFTATLGYFNLCTRTKNN